MKNHPLRFVLGLLLLTTLLVSGSAAAQDAEPDAPAGWERFVRPVLDSGKNGQVMFPAAFSGATPNEIFDPRGFAVHMTRADEPGEERVFPAGQPFIPPSGRWRMWLQSEWQMSPSSRLVIWRSGTWGGTSIWTQDVAPAGYVSAPDVEAHDRGLDLWLLYAGNSPGWNYHELSRRRPLAEAIKGVLMPAGPVIAGLWDPRQERYVALSSEFWVAAGQTTPAPLARPAATEASALIYAMRPDVPPDALEDVELTLSRDGTELPPGFTVKTNWGVYRGWQELPPGPAVLSGGNEVLYLDARTVELEGGAVAGFEEFLVERPILEVSLVLPALLREKPFTLEVRRLPAGERLAKVELPPKAGRHRFQDGLVNDVLEVELVTHVGSFRRQVDLTAGGEAFLGLEPELIEIYGTVRRDGERHRGTVIFQTASGEKVTADADENGEYGAIALEPLRWVDVQLEGVEQEPWRDFFMPAIRSSQQLDFDVPDVEITIRVVDAASREGIAGAAVLVRNEYWPPDESTSMADPVESGTAGRAAGRGGGRVIVTSHTTDGSGEIQLPPPRPGRVELDAEAPGYRPLQQPVVLEIDDPPRDRELEILLDPAGDTVRVRLALPDGSPAAGAKVLRVDSISIDTTLFTGVADAGGIVEVPVEPAHGLLLLKHPAAAFGIVEWQTWKDQEDSEWVFPPAAGHALVLRALDPSSEEPAAGAALSLWVGERKLSERAMRWLLDADSRTDRNGFWTADRLPRARLRALAWSRHLREEAQSGRLDSLATEISYPWPAQVEVRAVQ